MFQIQATQFTESNSTERRPSWKANKSAAKPRISHILLSAKVHYHIHKSPPPVHLLSHINPVHVSPFHFLKICFNITLPSMSRSSKYSLSLRFFHLIFYFVVPVKYWSSSLRSFLQSPITLSLSLSDTQFAVQHWKTLCLWHEKCVHLVISIWLCGPQIRHTLCCCGDC